MPVSLSTRDYELLFLKSQLGASALATDSIDDLRYKYYKGINDGTISAGGGGKNWIPGKWCLPGVLLDASQSNESNAAGTIYMDPFIVGAAGTLTDVALRVGTVAGTAGQTGRAGVWKKNPANPDFWDLVSDLGTFLIDVANTQRSFTPNLSLAAPGVYGISSMYQGAASATAHAVRFPLFGPQNDGAFATNVATTLQNVITYGALPSTLDFYANGGFSNSVARAMVKMS